MHLDAVRGAVEDDRRGDEVPALAKAAAAGGEAALLAPRGGEEVFDGLALLIGDERADLRALVGGTDGLDPNLAYAVDLAVVISPAIERTDGEQ